MGGGQQTITYLLHTANPRICNASSCRMLSSGTRLASQIRGKTGDNKSR